MERGFQIPLSAPELMARARSVTGVDLVDEAVLEPLTVLHASLNEESRLHELGAVAKQNKLLRLLCNRLRMQRDFAAHPEIAKEEIKPPVIVYGMGRSGTTKTQKLLAATGDFNFLPFWQAYNPSLISGKKDEDPAVRIEDADAYCRWFDAVSPESKFGHAFETFEPEEDTVLTEGCFRAPTFLGYAEVPSYLSWLGGQDPTPLFEFLRDTLKYLQWQGLASSKKKWVLKAPTYFGLEPAMLSVFPAAHLVMTHRSPLQSIPSVYKLANCFHTPFCDSRMSSPAMSQGMAAMMNLQLAFRAANPSVQFLDLHFNEISKSSQTAVEKVYAHIGLPFTEEARLRVRAWDAEHPMHKLGSFKYSLEEFGLSKETIRADMSAYIKFIESLSMAA